MPEINTTRISCANCKLAELCLPHGLQQQEISQLSAIIKDKRPLQAGELLFWQGQRCENLYAVKSGSFRCYIANEAGEEQTIGFYLPGELMGLEAFQHGRFNCSTLALETASVCELPLRELNNLCAAIPSLQHQVMRILGQEITSDHSKILLGHRPARQRMATFLLMLSKRYASLGFSSTLFNLTMSRYDMANFLGLTIETVSRQLGSLGQLGIITVKQRCIQINDLEALQTLADICSNATCARPSL